MCGSDGFSWGLLESADVCSSLHGLEGACTVCLCLLECDGVCLGLMGTVVLSRGLLGPAGLCWILLGSERVYCQGVLRSAGVC